MRKWFLMLLLISGIVYAKSNDPAWNVSPAYNNIRYFYNEYTRQNDGVYYGQFTSSDSARLGGQLPSYYATQTSLGSEITNRQNADNGLQGQITGLSNNTTNYAVKADVAASTTTLKGLINNLQNNATDYVPYTGAVYNVDLGSHSVLSSNLATNYMLIQDSTTVKWYFNIGANGRPKIQNYVP